MVWRMQFNDCKGCPVQCREKTSRELLLNKGMMRFTANASEFKLFFQWKGLIVLFWYLMGEPHLSLRSLGKCIQITISVQFATITWE